MKSLSTSTRGIDGRLAVVSCLQVLYSRCQKEGAGRSRVFSSLRIFQEVEVVRVCTVTLSCLPAPDFGTEPPGPGEVVRS